VGNIRTMEFTDVMICRMCIFTPSELWLLDLLFGYARFYSVLCLVYARYNIGYFEYPIVPPRHRSQWPRSLRRELSSPSWTLGSWVRIALEACMSVCVYSVFVLSYV
jgi:hypothetical protein